MNIYSISVTTLFILISLPFFGHALFEYICDEKHLYKPYLHVYKGRKGARILDVGPGFHEVTEFRNVYVCINGPAYLYFSKNTRLGEVYESAQLKKYAHTCEMYNVQPREGSASVKEVQLHLRAVLLLGDPEDYRRISIQKFTAPYFFHKDQLNTRIETEPNYTPIPPHYINATSLIIIGQSECTLSKGGKETQIKIRPYIFPPATGTGSTSTVEVGYLCKIGFKSLLDKATTPPGGPKPTEENRAPALALINDEAIRVEHCDASTVFNLNGATEFYQGAKDEVANVDKNWDTVKGDHIANFTALMDATVVPLKDEYKNLETKKTDPNTKPREVRKLEKTMEKLDRQVKTEEEKKKIFEAALDAISLEQTLCDGYLKEADPAEAKATKAKDSWAASEKLKEEWDSLKNQTPPVPQSDIDAKKVEYENALTEATTSVREYQWALSDLKVGLSRLSKLVSNAKRLKVYKASPPKNKFNKDKNLGMNPDGTMPVIIVAKEGDCEKLPLLEGDDGECKKGKPDKDASCNLFKVSLGATDPWQDPTREDLWKKEILTLIGDIFVTACDRIPNVKKFVMLNNRVMGMYLTDDKIFNMKPNFQTDTCVNYKFSNNMKILGSAGNLSPVDVKYKEEKAFWTTIKAALQECKWSGRRLSFKDVTPATGQYKFVKDPATDHETEHDILFHEEQADQEFSYNWPIDMNWKMFVTVMGLCMSNYEKKIPLITSRFFSLYTEYFLIPLRETWINPKDNMIFQFVLGEFYNGDAEFWADMCMESSFIAAGQRDYRPPRSVLVNCASEHNYFVNGEFSKGKRGR